jgi:LPXTG-motif cell wall-anchored protein
MHTNLIMGIAFLALAGFFAWRKVNPTLPGVFAVVGLMQLFLYFFN